MTNPTDSATCPTCGSGDPKVNRGIKRTLSMHPYMTPCPDPFHTPTPAPTDTLDELTTHADKDRQSEAYKDEAAKLAATDEVREALSIRAERALDSLAVRILCGEGGCHDDKPCPFEPMCAADLTPECQQKEIEQRFAALSRDTEHTRLMREVVEAVGGWAIAMRQADRNGCTQADLHHINACEKAIARAYDKYEAHLRDRLTDYEGSNNDQPK